VGELTGLPIPLLDLRGPTSKGRGKHGREGRGGKSKGAGEGDEKGESVGKWAYRHFFFPTLNPNTHTN